MIDSVFLHDMAAFVESKIAKVLINGTYEITNFTIKSVTDSKVHMEYLIPNGAVSEVTSMSLVAADGSVITTSAVFLPITSDTTITHTFTILEV